ncbi:glycoside hydrolase family 19 protein, partial [Priestia megaterium]|uniref:glycoside hydrolase family 19 protein n=1 Tax=Priestia megaterium TaxID=1404 RepID=UPI0026EAC586
DGWRFRGRGLVMLTGRNNYAAVGPEIGVDLVGDPDRMCEPSIALRASIRWWERTLPDAVMDNLIAVTKRVNGGLVGLDERGLLTQRARRALEAV